MSDTSQVKPQAGNIVVEREFDVSGKRTDGSAFEMKGFKVRILFSDTADMRDAAARSVVIACQNKVRTALRKGESLPYRPGTQVTVNSKGNTELTPEEKAQRAVDDILAKPELLAHASEEQVAKLLELLGAKRDATSTNGSETNRTTRAQSVQDESHDDDESNQDYKYNEDVLAKLSISKLRALAQKEGIDDYDDLDKEQLIEALAFVEKD